MKVECYCPLNCLKLLKQYRTIEQMCSDAHSITLSKTGSTHAVVLTSLRMYTIRNNPIRNTKTAYSNTSLHTTNINL